MCFFLQDPTVAMSCCRAILKSSFVPEDCPGYSEKETTPARTIRQTFGRHVLALGFALVHYFLPPCPIAFLSSPSPGGPMRKLFLLSRSVPFSTFLSICKMAAGRAVVSNGYLEEGAAGRVPKEGHSSLVSASSC